MRKRCYNRSGVGDQNRYYRQQVGGRAGEHLLARGYLCDFFRGWLCKIAIDMGRRTTSSFTES